MPLINSSSKGVYVIAVTPFADNGAIDTDSIDSVTDFYLQSGADGLTILGMMGEAPKLTHAEALLVTERTLKRAGEKPVIAGVSAPGLAGMKELTKAVMDMGAAGVMVAPPSSLKTNEQILAYYQQAVETLGEEVPVVLQDFPLSTGVAISTATLGQIIDTCPSIVMVKHEDWPGLAKITALREAEARGRRRVSILCGNGGIFLPEEMARGADGAMTGFGYPEMMVQVCSLAASGDMDRAQDIFDAYLPLVRYEQQPGIGLGARKHVLARRGAIRSSAQRRPGAPLTLAAIAEIERLIIRQEKRLAAIG